jgi:hypothetical protein
MIVLIGRCGIAALLCEQAKVRLLLVDKSLEAMPVEGGSLSLLPIWEDWSRDK